MNVVMNVGFEGLTVEVIISSTIWNTPGPEIYIHWKRHHTGSVLISLLSETFLSGECFDGEKILSDK